MISRLFIVVGVGVVLAACASGEKASAPSPSPSGPGSSNLATPAMPAAADAEEVVARLASAGMCYSPSESIAEAMGDATVCMESPNDQFAGLVVSPRPWSSAAAAASSACTGMSDLDKFGIISGGTWYMQPTTNQTRSVMENYADITGGEWLTWKRACA